MRILHFPHLEIFRPRKRELTSKQVRIQLPHEVLHLPSHLLGCLIAENLHRPNLLPSEFFDLRIQNSHRSNSHSQILAHLDIVLLQHMSRICHVLPHQLMKYTSLCSSASFTNDALIASLEIDNIGEFLCRALARTKQVEVSAT